MSRKAHTDRKNKRLLVNIDLERLRDGRGMWWWLEGRVDYFTAVLVMVRGHVNGGKPKTERPSVSHNLLRQPQNLIKPRVSM